jgi:hypothetical protein
MASIANVTNEAALVENTAEFITHFLDTRFVDLPDEWKVALAEVCLEMFTAGAQWADATAGREEKTIITRV